MAGKKISELTALGTTFAATDLFEISSTSGGGFVSRKITGAEMTSSVSLDIGGSVASGTVGSILFIGTGPVLAQDNANFFWDDSNNRLGIGVTDPDSFLEVFGTTTQQKWSYDADSFASLTVADASHATVAT